MTPRVGSTNFDSRSLGINDQVNLAALDAALAERLDEDFHHVLAAHSITFDYWSKRRPSSASTN
jgi:cardiolipin synthase